jgi:hypothetical protein
LTENNGVTLCKACGASAIQNGVCQKCGDTAGLNNYGYSLQRLNKKHYVLLKDGASDPILLFSGLGRTTKTDIAKATGAPVAVVAKSLAALAVIQAEPAKDKTASTTTTTTEQPEVYEEATRQQAWALLRDPAFFYKLGKVFEVGFIVPKINKPRFILKEERNKRLLGPLLIGAARLGMTSLIRVIGEPGTAKDTMVRMWLKLLPVHYLERSYLTAAAIRYSQNVKDADLLYIPDSPEIHGETGRQLLFMRADDGGLISEYATRDTETGEMTTKTVTLPIKGVVTTSNQVVAGAALLSGMWTLNTNPDLDLTRKVKEAKLQLRAGKRGLLDDESLKLWRCAFDILLTEKAEKDIDVPFADKLVNLLESERSESRRDPDRLCDLICLVAWMRRFQKPVEEAGSADIGDYFIALQIGLDAITQTIAELNEKELRVYQAIPAQGDTTCREIADSTRIPYKTVYRVLEGLIEKGYVNYEQIKGRNRYTILGDKKPATVLFNEGRNDDSPDKLLELVLNSVRTFSPSHGIERAVCGSELKLVDPITAKRIIIDSDLSCRVEPALLNDVEYLAEVTTHTLGCTREKVRSVETGSNQALTGEQTSKEVLPSELRSEKPVFSFKQVKPAEPCQLCGQLAVEYEIADDNGASLRRCAACFNKMRSKFAEAEWRPLEWTT